MAKRRVPTIPQRTLASELERRREATDPKLSRDAVSDALQWNRMKIYRIETARVTADAGDVLLLAGLYKLDEDDTKSLVELARQARRRSWWKGMTTDLPAGFDVHLGLEEMAKAMRVFETQWVPGLLQTADYARAVLGAGISPATPAQIDQKVELRTRRQEVLRREEPPAPDLWAVLDEGVIRRAVGGRRVMRSQLQHLHNLAGIDRPNVTIQILPFSAGEHPAGYGSFALFEPANPAFPVAASSDRMDGSLIEDAPDAIAEYKTIYDHLLGTALSPSVSREFLAEAIALL